MVPGRLHAAEHLKGGERIRADAVIVGSGAGGSAVAAELTRAGMKVAVLEEGRSFAPADLVTKPSWAFRHLYIGRGPIVGRGKVLIPMTAGRAVGGSTFVNSAICFRAPSNVLQEWERDYGSPWTPERLAPLFANTERVLEVSKTTANMARNNSLVFKRGADKLGLTGDFISRNAPGCVGCGVCQLGCPTGGKGSVDKNLLPEAIAGGADVYSEVRATKVHVDKGVARGVSANILGPDDETLGTLEVEAPRVFLCGGALGTPQLLQRSKVGNDHVGEHLHVHPAQSAAALFDEEIRYWDGVTQGYYVRTEDSIIETFTATPELFWAALPLGQMNLRKVKHAASAGCMVRDRGEGRVRFQGEGKLPDIEYEAHDDDFRRFLLGARQMARIYFAAGATTVFPLLNPMIEAAHTLDEALAQLPDDLPKTRFNPYASHPQGTCRMSADPKNGACKPDGELHGVQNLFVADGSIFPTALGVNPQITILSLATGIARDVAHRG